VAASTESQEAAPDGEHGGMSDPHVVEVSRTISAPPDQVWQLMTSPIGSAALLGDGAVLGGKGEPWRTASGAHGVVRSYHPLEQLRVSWHADDDGPASLVEMDLRPSGEGTELVVRHERVADGSSVDLHQHWSQAMDRLAASAAT
jgi:uncharacterized protein YndB with AHSA1/START domain